MTALHLSLIHIYCCGLTESPTHVTTARDIAIMSRELINRYPQIHNYSTIWMENITHVTLSLIHISGGDIELTEKGREKAAAIYERHKLLTSFLQKVAGVPEEVAEDDACLMYHIISDEVFQGIKRFMNES